MFDNGVHGDDPRCSGISCTPHNEFCTEITSSKTADDAGASVPDGVIGMLRTAREDLRVSCHGSMGCRQPSHSHLSQILT